MPWKVFTLNFVIICSVYLGGENVCHYTENTRQDKEKAEKSAVEKTRGFLTAL